MSNDFNLGENQISLKLKTKRTKAHVSLVFDWTRWNYHRCYWSELTARDFYPQI